MTTPVLPPATLLSSVLADTPAAVLLVDLSQRAVVHLNTVAEELAPGVRLPVGLDEWSDAAVLRDPDGAELSETTHPLSRVARSEPVMGQVVSAARRTSMGERREPLWVVALPLDDAPMLRDHALVVLVPLPDDTVSAAAALGRQQAELRDRAVLATGLSFTLADATAPDQPLVWVNPAFTATTGYTFEDVVGRNCRFLQCAATDPSAPAAIRAALDAGESITTTLLNQRKDGSAFWNQVSISPIFGPDGELTHFVGIQTDVSDRVAADQTRDAALQAERTARADAEAAQGRLRFLAEATSRLSGTLDVRECQQALIELVVPHLADWVMVVHVDDHGDLSEIAAHHHDPTRAEPMASMARDLPGALRAGPVAELLLAGTAARRTLDLDQPSARAERLGYLADESFMVRADTLGTRSALFVPLPGRRKFHDLLILARGPEREQFSATDLDDAVDLGRRAGLILDNARLFSTQQLIAETLQRSLLPELPRIPGIEVAARYQAGQSGAEVGGDFYELMQLPDGAVGLVVGDVMGHDVLAAAAMGHLKGLIRACAYDAGGSSPASVLERVDQLVAGLGMPTIATAVYAHLKPVGDQWRVSFTNAGHPPLVVRRADGSCEFLETASGTNDVLLGVRPGQRTETERLLPAGTTLIGFTDGLVERRGEVIDQGLARLRDVVRHGPEDVDELCDHLLAMLGHDIEDDVAVIAVRL